MSLPKISVLVEGCAKKEDNSWKAFSTVTLIETSSDKIIVDPGCNREMLLSTLSKRNINIGDITFVVLTHAHLDHTLLAGLFTKAQIITAESFSLYSEDQIMPLNPTILGEKIKILKTPGHIHEHISLIVETEKEKVAIVGDLFFWLDNEEQIIDIYKEDQAQCFGVSHEDLVASRKRIIDLCDTIIPGHGKEMRTSLVT